MHVCSLNNSTWLLLNIRAAIRYEAPHSASLREQGDSAEEDAKQLFAVIAPRSPAGFLVAKTQLSQRGGYASADPFDGIVVADRRSTPGRPVAKGFEAISRVHAGSLFETAFVRLYWQAALI